MPSACIITDSISASSTRNPRSFTCESAPAEEFDVALAIDAAEVARAIDARVRFTLRREWIWQKPRLRAAGKSHIAARNTDPANPQLADLAVRNGPQAIIEKVHAVAGNGASIVTGFPAESSAYVAITVASVGP